MKSRHFPPVVLLFAAFGLFAASGLSQQDGSLPLFDDPTQEESNNFKRASVQEKELPLFDDPTAPEEEPLVLDTGSLQADKAPALREPVPVAEEVTDFVTAEDPELVNGDGAREQDPFGQTVNAPARITAAPQTDSDLIRHKYLQLAAERAALMNADEISAEVEKTELQIVELKARKGVNEAISILAEVEQKYPGTLAAKQARAMIAGYSGVKEDSNRRFREVEDRLSGVRNTGLQRARTEGNRRVVAEENEETIIEIRRVSGFEDFPEPSLSE